MPLGGCDKPRIVWGGGEVSNAPTEGVERREKLVNQNKIILISLAVMVAACVSSGTKVTQQQAAAFEVGKTTEAQVVAALGAPNQTSTLSDGTRLDIYMHIDAHANAASYIPVVGLFAGGAKGTNDMATFTFTSAGVLKSTSSSSGTTNVNTGLANQH